MIEKPIDDKYYDLPEPESQFGHGMIPYFTQDLDYINVNFASFGTPPKYVEKTRKTMSKIVEQNPELFYYTKLEPYLNKIKQEVAHEFNVDDINDIVLLDSISQGMSSFMRSFPFENNDYIIHFEFAYPMIRYISNYVETALKEAKVKKIPLTTEQIRTKEGIIDAVKNFLDTFNDGTMRVAILEHISAMPSLIFPVKEIIALFNEKKIITIIDGAHTYSHINFDLKDIDADIYICNMNKWGFCNVGCTFMYAKKYIQDIFYSSIINEKYNLTFKEKFAPSNEKDWTPWLSFTAAKKFRDTLGSQRIMDYNHKLILQAGKLIANMWKTETLTSDDLVGFMVNVLLPEQNPIVLQNGNLTNIYTDIWNRYHIIAVVVILNGKFYVRFGAHIINELKDYEYAAKFILEYLEISRKNAQETIEQ